MAKVHPQLLSSSGPCQPDTGSAWTTSALKAAGASVPEPDTRGRKKRGPSALVIVQGKSRDRRQTGMAGPQLQSPAFCPGQRQHKPHHHHPHATQRCDQLLLKNSLHEFYLMKQVSAALCSCS